MSRDDGYQTRRLWFLAALGPVTWFLDHSIGYAISPPAHRANGLELLRGLHVVALMIAVAGVAFAIRELPSSQHDDGDIRRGRTQLIALGAVAIGSICVFLIAGNLLASLLLAGHES
jgi:hypothetical protein